MIRRGTSVASLVVSFAALAGLAACNPYLAAQSVAPPGRTARLDSVDGFWGIERYRLEVSAGVALAITCIQGGDPCEHVTAASDDPAIAEVRPASLGVLERSSYGNQIPSSAIVIVGKTPGITRVHLRARKRERDVVVTVIAPPAPVTAQTEAR